MLPRCCASASLITFYLASWVWSLSDLEKGSGLSFFISRPDIRSPKINVTTYDENAVQPGYIFTAPYYSLSEKPASTSVIRSFQLGPHIYDNHGELVWSGGDLTQNRVATDFRPATINGESHLTFLLTEPATLLGAPKGKAYILNSSYDAVQIVDLNHGFDIHEFVALDSTTSFLRILRRNATTEQMLPGQTLVVQDTCAAEVDTEDNELFSFCPSKKLTREDIAYYKPDPDKVGTRPSDLYHMNSIAKFPNGDYLTSIRFTDTVYRVSGTTGEIVWRLGGNLTDFVQDFNFSGQHDARVVSEDDTMTVLSIFDNASVNDMRHNTTSSCSNFKIVALYTGDCPKRAELLKQFDRPDGKHTRYRGNGQYYSSNGGSFVNWSEYGYATEFGPDGRVVQEVRLQGHRLSSYRSYKGVFVGMPNTSPDLTTRASSNYDQDGMSMMSFMSWNGATEVAVWELFGSEEQEQGFESLGTFPRTGFETSFGARRACRYTWVQARDREGNVLGRSKTMETEYPPSISIETHEGLSGPAHQSIGLVVERTCEPWSLVWLFELSATVSMMLVVIVAGLMGVGITTTTRFFWKRLCSGVLYGPRHAYDLVNGQHIMHSA